MSTAIRNRIFNLTEGASSGSRYWTLQFEEKSYEVTDTLADGRYNLSSSIVQNPLNKKKVAVIYISGVGPNYDDTKILKIKTSNWYGYNQSAARTIYDPGGVLCVQESHAGYTSDGRLHILCTLLDNASVCSLIYLYSDDDGTSFTISDISALVSDVTYTTFRNSGTLIENNGVLLSVFYSRNAGSTSYRRLCLRLVDGTWTKVTIETTAASETESSIESLSGDNLIILTRCDAVPGFIQYTSSDNGLTWSRLGFINFGIVPNFAWPAQMRSFLMEGEKIIVFYFPSHRVDLNYPLHAIYGRASDILSLGLLGWNYPSLKVVTNAVAPYSYVYHGDTLHYNNNYNALGCWPSIKADFSSAALLTFEIDTTNYDTLKDLLLAPAPVTSYVNAGGIGDRTAIISITNTIGISGTQNQLVDGVKTMPPYEIYFTAGNTVGKNINFDFGLGARKIINEVKFYRNSISHGVWRWQGSNEESATPASSSFVTLSDQFTIIGANPQTITVLSSNRNGFRHYRLLGVSGTVNATQPLAEFEFKIVDE